MNTITPASDIQTYSQGPITIDLKKHIFWKLQQQSVSIAEFIQNLTRFITQLEGDKARYNINPYTEKFSRGIYILGTCDSKLSVFPNPDLVLKCSEGHWNAENPRKQFFRSIQLAWEFETKLSAKERALLQICPVYLHFQTHLRNALFKRVLFMPRIHGTPLGRTETGFSAEFCQVFKIPDLQEIRHQARFWLHRLLDRDQKRQLLKIQSAYLFQRLSERGIRILSLNQKNILATSDSKGDRTQYTIIDPIADYCMPISPAYNLLTAQLCRFR